MFKFLFCKHKNQRCIHGDEINQTIRAWFKPTLARARCLDCGKALYDVPIPKTCFYGPMIHIDN